MSNIKKHDLILITGGGGGLGFALKTILADLGYCNVVSPSRQEMDLLSREGVEYYFSKYKPKVVLHLASLVYGLLGNLENQFKSLYQNTEINSNLMYVIEKSNVKYIFFAGSVASYPYPYTSIPLNENAFFNGLPHSGEFGYAMAKRHAYSYLNILKEYKGIEFTYGIFTNLYGDNDKFNIHLGHVIPSLIAKAKQSKLSQSPLDIWGDGSAVRDFMHFNDASKAIVHSMENGIQDLLNISSGVGVSIRDVSVIIAEAYELKDLRYLSDKPAGIPMRIVDNLKLITSGFIQEIDIVSGLKKTCEWYENNSNTARK